MLPRVSLLAAASLAMTASASAQFVNLYTFSQSVGSYSPITGGTLLGTASTSNTLDDVNFAVTLPFAFSFNGSSQTQVTIQSNGHLAFGPTAPPTTTYTPLSSTAAVAGFVSACGRDLQGGYVFAGTRTLGSDQLTGISAIGPVSVGDVIVGAGIPAGTTVLAISGSTITMSANATANSVGTAVTAYGPWSEMRWEVQGTAPNRVFIAQWSNFRRFGTTLTTTSGTFFNFQIRLYEDGAIEAVYGNCDPGATTTTFLHQVGLRGPDNTFATNVNNRLNTKGVNDDWSASAPGVANTSGMLFNSVAPANVIPNGLTYRWELTGSAIATNTTLGTGCGATYSSFYQFFPDAAVASVALQGNVLSLIATPTGYVGSWMPGAAGLSYVPPVSPIPVPTGDDGVVAVTPSAPLSTPYGSFGTLQVSGNAIIGLGAGTMTYPGTNSFTPTAGGFLNGALGGFYAWHDYNSAEAGSGPIVREETGGTLYITFDDVENYPTGVVNRGTIQFQLDLASGNVRIVFLVVDNNTASTFGSAHLVGVTAPGPSLDPGPTSLATATLVTSFPEVPPLALAALNRPVQQVVGPNNWNLSASNLPSGIGLDLIGLSDPSATNPLFLDLSLIGLGQPGCQLRAFDLIAGTFVAAGTHTWSVTIPGGAPALSGAELFVQNAVLDPSLLLSLTKTSNGIKGTIGDV